MGPAVDIAGCPRSDHGLVGLLLEKGRCDAARGCNTYFSHQRAAQPQGSLEGWPSAPAVWLFLLFLGPHRSLTVSIPSLLSPQLTERMFSVLRGYTFLTPQSKVAGWVITTIWLKYERH